MTDNILTFAKILVDQGIGDLNKDDFTKAIEARAAGIRKAGETAAQAFTRFCTDYPDGKLLLKAVYRAAPKPALASASSAPSDNEQDFVERGPADTEMRALIERHQRQAAKDGKPLSYSQAFVRVYEEAGNKKLKARYDAEQAATMAKCAGVY